MKHFVILAQVVFLVMLGSHAWAVEANPITPGSWTMILLPDTQNYCDTDPEALIFNAQTQWIADHQTSHNIQMVLHQGDVTNNNTTAQFNRAKVALGILDTAGVPYSVAPGNHDYGPSGNSSNRESLFNSNSYFGPTSVYASQSHFTGSNGGFYEAGTKTDNSYCTFSAGGQDWLVFSTEFGPRDGVVEWMDDVADAHPGYNFILNTHAYMYYDDTRYDWATYGTSQSWNPHNYGIENLPGNTVNDGQEIWDGVIKKHPTWKFTFNGHVLNDGTGWLGSEGNNGNIVHQFLANYQMRANGGDGYLRILEFMDDGDTVKVSSYSPYQGAYLMETDQDFTFKMSEMPPEPPPPPLIHGVSAANLGVVDGTNVWSIPNSGPDPVATISPDNLADVSISIDGIPVYREQGVMLATIRQNIRGGYYGTVETSQLNYFSSLNDNILQIATSRAYNGGEFNVNPAVSFFPFADGWIGGHVIENGTLLDHYGVTSSNVSQISTGRYEISIDGIDSQNDGMLFIVGGENGHNNYSTAPLADGSGWEIASRDNTATTFSAFESNRWSFVYIDYDAPGLTGGRITSSGSLVDGVGTFSISHIGTGVYRIMIPGYTPNDGVLMLSIAEEETDGITAPDDNIISYEADGNAFLVNVRDRNGSSTLLEDGAFVFAFIAFDNQQLMPAVPGDANYDGKVNMLDMSILSDHWGETDEVTWRLGDFNLDGKVGAEDASILAANWGFGTGAESTVPEPSILALLAGLTLGVLLRRKQ